MVFLGVILFLRAPAEHKQVLVLWSRVLLLVKSCISLDWVQGIPFNIASVLRMMKHVSSRAKNFFGNGKQSFKSG